MPTDWKDDIHQEVIEQRKKQLLIYKIVRYITGMTAINKCIYKSIYVGYDGKKYGNVKVGHYIIGVGEGYECCVIADEHDEDAIYDVDKHTVCALLNLIKQQKAKILGGTMYGEEAE